MTELNFKGKEFVYNHHLAVPFRPLMPDETKGIGPVALDGNLIVHGDNLHALKALLPLYAGRVDCIFIDPPYNTGNEGWAYNDNVNAPMIREWLESNPIGIEDGLRHDKWCAMMWPRLRMLYELLADHGTMWVTLDHNEIDHALLILKSIFGQDSVLAIITTEANPRGRQSDVHFATVNDYLICIAKYPDEVSLHGVFASEEYISEFKHIDDNKEPWRELGLRQRGADSLRSDREDMYFPIYVNPSSGAVSLVKGRDYSEQVIPKKSTGVDGRWSWSPSYVQENIDRVYGRLVNGRGGSRWDIFYRDYLNRNGDQRRKKARTIWPSLLANTEMGGLIYKNIVPDQNFSYPKPVELLREILTTATDKGSIVLDSFAGSGTTAHAVLEANKRDGGNRRFILVEMEDYADKMTAERVRRVINGYAFTGTQRTELLRDKITWTKLKNANKITEAVETIENLHGHEYDAIKKTVKDGELIVTGEKAVEDKTEGLGGSFTYCTLGDPVELDKILSGETLPSFDGIGSVLFHMATAHAFDPATMREDDFYLGTVEGQHLWLIYKPDLDWLKSPEAALTLKRAKDFAATDKDARHLVFAPARYVSQKMLSEQNIPVEFVPLPFALYRIDRS